MKHVVQATSFASGDIRYFSSVKGLVRSLSGGWIAQQDDQPGTMSHKVVLLTDSEGYDPAFSQERFTAVLQELIDQLPRNYRVDSRGQKHVTETAIRRREQALKTWEPLALSRLREVLPPALK